MSQSTPEMATKTDYWDTHELYIGLAATTPYVWPTGCPPLGSIQNYTVRLEPGDNSEKVIFEELRIVWPMGDGPGWARCLPKEPYEDPDPLPSGAPNNAYWTYSRSATYSPGVCPTGWDALNVGVTTRTEDSRDQFHGKSGEVRSTAVCCMKGDSIDTKLVPWLPHCVGKEAEDGHHETMFITKTSTRRVGVSTSVSSATWTNQYRSNDKDYTTTRSGLQSDISYEYPEETHTYTWTTGQFWYPAWSIVWDNNDASTMSPKPPALTNDMLIPTWTEGMVLEDGKYDNGGRGQALGTVTTTGASEPSTTTDRNAVTTPFVFGSGCLPPGFVSTVTQRIDLWETITERIRFLSYLDREWRKCLPDVGPETTNSWPSTTKTVHGLKTATYSAAVCPSGWWALNMGLSTNTGYNVVSWDGTTTVLTTAQCCSSLDYIATPKYQNGMVVGAFDDYCVESRISRYNTRTPISIPFTDRYTSWIKIPGVMTSTIIDNSLGVTTTSTSSYFWESPSYSESTGTHIWTEGQFFYPPWSIFWQDSDTSTMSPKPPALSNDMIIREWYPGMQIVSGLWDWRGSGAKERTQTVTATEMATTTETISASTVVSMHYVQVAGPSGVDEEEMIRSGLLQPKIGNKPAEYSVGVGGDVAGATEVDGKVLAVRLLLLFLWLSFMVGGAWMFWLKRRRQGSKGEIELDERVGSPPQYMEVAREEEREVPRRDRELLNANDNPTDHVFHHLNDDIALRVEARKS